MISALNWVQINERLLEIERSKEISDDMKREYNDLLDIPIAGILVRKKYEVSKAKKRRKEKEETAADGNDAGSVPPDMDGETASQ